MDFKNFAIWSFTTAPYILDPHQDGSVVEYRQDLRARRGIALFIGFIALTATPLAYFGAKGLLQHGFTISNATILTILVPYLWYQTVVSYRRMGGLAVVRVEAGRSQMLHRSRSGKERCWYTFDEALLRIALRRVHYQTALPLEFTGYGVFVLDDTKAFPVAIQLHTPDVDDFDLPVPECGLVCVDEREHDPLVITHGSVSEALKSHGKKRFNPKHTLWHKSDDTRHERGLESWRAYA